MVGLLRLQPGIHHFFYKKKLLSTKLIDFKIYEDKFFRQFHFIYFFLWNNLIYNLEIHVKLISKS
jgi:hypothetical protein